MILSLSTTKIPDSQRFKCLKIWKVQLLKFLKEFLNYKKSALQINRIFKEIFKLQKKCFTKNREV